MRDKFWSENELMTMPIKVLRGLDIDDQQEEEVVQRIVDRRMSGMPVEGRLSRQGIPDIETPEQEAYWQKVVDDRVRQMRPVGQLKVQDQEMKVQPQVSNPVGQASYGETDLAPVMDDQMPVGDPVETPSEPELAPEPDVVSEPVVLPPDVVVSPEATVKPKRKYNRKPKTT